LESHPESGFTIVDNLLKVDLVIFIRIDEKIIRVKKIGDWFIGHRC
jgi:hypothetical protein